MKNAGIAVRVLMLVVGLAALATIGRFAAARASVAVTSLDAGTLPVIASIPLPVPAPPPPAPAEPPASPVLTVAPPSSARATADDPVYVNYASAEQLRRLPGVGPKRAEAIVALRARMGRFQRVEDLLRVKGIGRATVKKWRTLLRLDVKRAETQADAGAP